MEGYILSVDQSTQGTKGLLFDKNGMLVEKVSIAHKQYINAQGWVEHDMNEILANVIKAAGSVLEKSGIDKRKLRAVGISNQRETSAAWDIKTGVPAYRAIVWQCSRAEEQCARLADKGERIWEKTGLKLSPFFPAAKYGWMLENVESVRRLREQKRLAFGTIDSWLVYCLCRERPHKTDYSNASRTQLLNLNTLSWDEEICSWFGIPLETLPEPSMSDAVFGYTNLGGILDREIPVCGVLGDSHGALFGQNCRTPGKAKATYGTGSSVMMNIGTEMKLSRKGLVTSIAWGIKDKVEYVFEGNLNYTGGSVSWLRDEVGLISEDMEASLLAENAKPGDKTYFVPAFTGLGAPYWDSRATAMFTGITRTTGRAELAKAVLDSIAYQISDLTELMKQETGIPIKELRTDGGPTKSNYLMQMQSDFSDCIIRVPQIQELSGLGAAYLAGIAEGLYEEEVLFEKMRYIDYKPRIEPAEREAVLKGWKEAVARALYQGTY